MGTEKAKVHYRVHGVNIDKGTLKDVKSIDDLKKKEIFSHLSRADQDAAYAQLFADLKPAAVAPVAPKAEPAKA